MVLLVSETAIVDEKFLEDINNLLKSGEVSTDWNKIKKIHQKK